ncbi:MAG: Nramp family divalent metal transporter [Planctomycetes bacterium]|nr:Nramp family divalent metal transporter [Planctomycetota bacterium]
MILGRIRNTLALLAPGILVAATGVGSGDLITAAFGGTHLGVGIAWAALVGSLLKWSLNEGLARWQMATNTTLLEGWYAHLGRWIRYVFFFYLLIWTFVTGGALVNACGVAGYALWPIGKSVATSKIIWGVVHSVAGFVLVWIGGFKLFERLMGVCIGIMFCTVLLTAILIVMKGISPGEFLAINVPSDPVGRKWMIGILGGVGGTVTLLSYGYWIRNAHRAGLTGVRACRIDLAAGYMMTGLFGVAMIVIGSRLTLVGKGDMVALLLADQLKAVLGSFGGVAKWAFLFGFWGAVFSSLLGVWQSAPYFFADLALIRRRERTGEWRMEIPFEQTRVYRVCLLAISTLPLILLWQQSTTIQLAYSVLGACFMPLLALTLLILNNGPHVAKEYRNGIASNTILLVTLAFFAYQGGVEMIESLASKGG